ncbi:MAG: DUF192 domain-containing protein [Acidimicrobiia bacterium]|jgi:uncharacterized membrane protein (UPF0127 family)
MGWLVHDGRVLAAMEVATDRRARRRGLLGRDRFDGVLLLRPCRQVHTIGMRMSIDVAYVDDLGIVHRIDTMARNRIGRISFRTSTVLEAAVGAFARWDLRVGDQVEFKE